MPRPVPLLLLLGVASLAAARGAEAHDLLILPEEPILEGAPFEVTFTGVWSYLFSALDREPTVAVDGATVSVVPDVFPSPILPPPETYVVSATIPALSAGTYEVELIPGADAGFAWDTATIDVFPRRVEIEPVVSPLIAGETATLRLTGQTRCPFDEDQVPALDGDLVLVEISLDCVADPPQNFEFFVETPPLPSGTWRLLAVEDLDGFGRGNLFGDGHLEVFPRPAVAGDRFTLDVDWIDFQGGTGIGRPVAPPGEQSALFWFFEPENWELMIKVLDGCEINGHWWVFSAGSTNVAWLLTIEDTATGITWQKGNPLGLKTPATADTEAFACLDPTGAAAPDEVSP